MTGPRLTQRKIDRLRDAINVVAETDEVNRRGSLHYWFADARVRCDDLERLLQQGEKK